ncbi:MAG: undecaprenyl/decaprenyl-phosphate alpha-N-acetylglucosaminyl 1-phosphate transferase [Armatimonadetes bacterium]|nr:undecaprenyl/decaprenyl-phosphate alpha-N-acetylglucosaminyl 1-phosphate transferase [Armatimonadota bacterium]
MIINIMTAAIAVAVAYVLTTVVRRFAQSRGIVANPGGRRVHAVPTPLLGGLAIYAGFIIAIFAAVVISGKVNISPQATGIVIGGTLVAIVGILDDKYELPGWAQAATILLAGLILCAFKVRIYGIVSPIRVEFGLWSIPVTVIWVLMVTKAVDCMDGLDGLAAGISAIAAGTLALMAAHFPGRAMSAAMASALCGAAIGFLRFNYPPAKVFMGTVGAQFLGFTLAGISILGTLKITALLAMVVPILVLAVPLFDTTFVVLKRAAAGKSIGEADTTHLHHRLVKKGLSHRQVIWCIYAITIASCSVAYWLFCRLGAAGK